MVSFVLAARDGGIRDRDYVVRRYQDVGKIGMGFVWKAIPSCAVVFDIDVVGTCACLFRCKVET